MGKRAGKKLFDSCTELSALENFILSFAYRLVQTLKLQIIWDIVFSIRANLFQMVCPFHFYDICKKVRVDSGCAYGKITQRSIMD